MDGACHAKRVAVWTLNGSAMTVESLSTMDELPVLSFTSKYTSRVRFFATLKMCQRCVIRSYLSHSVYDYSVDSLTFLQFYTHTRAHTHMHTHAQIHTHKHNQIPKGWRDRLSEQTSRFSHDLVLQGVDSRQSLKGFLRVGSTNGLHGCLHHFLVTDKMCSINNDVNHGDGWQRNGEMKQFMGLREPQ